ncbi:MAG: hypothetical protein AAFR22_13405 [Chloroflexota bacterium]
MDWTTLRYTLLVIAIAPPMSFLVALVVAHLFRWIPAVHARGWGQRAIAGSYTLVWAIVWWVALHAILSVDPPLTKYTYVAMYSSSDTDFVYMPEGEVDSYGADLGFTTATLEPQFEYAGRLQRWMLLPPPLRGSCAQYAYMDAPCGGDPTYERTHGTLPRYLAFNGLTMGVPGWMMWGIMRWELRRESRKWSKAES